MSKRGKKSTSKKKNKILGIPKRIIKPFFSLIALLGFAFVVWPKLSVFPGESLDPYRPFETPFILKNDGNLPLFDVDYSVKIEKVSDINNNQVINSSVRGFSEKIPKISRNTSSTIFINRVIDAPAGHITYAELYFYITYKPFLKLFTRKETRRFKIDKRWDGAFVWNEYFSKE